MDYRGVVLTVAVLGSALAGLSAACNHPDPGAIEFSERPGEPGQPQGSTSTTSSGGSTTSSSGAVDAGPVADPIFGTTAFAYVDPVTQAHDNKLLAPCSMAACFAAP